MTAEDCFKLYRGYKFFYDGSCKFSADGRPILKHPPLLKQFDRQYYHRLANKLNDATIHALFTVGFFHNPRAHISDLATPAAQKAAFRFAGRGENGLPLLESDFYELARPYMEPGDDKEALLRSWLYGDADTSLPECLMQVIHEKLPLDLACILFLIPQRDLNYNWAAYWKAKPDLGLGVHPWLTRLERTDQLLRMQRVGWRMDSHQLAKSFWNSLGIQSLAPIVPDTTNALF
jgi:hypothetical protein